MNAFKQGDVVAFLSDTKTTCPMVVTAIPNDAQDHVLVAWMNTLHVMNTIVLPAIVFRMVKAYEAKPGKPKFGAASKAAKVPSARRRR